MQRTDRRRGVAALEVAMLMPFIVTGFVILLGVGHATLRKLVALSEARYQAWALRTEPRPAEQPMALGRLDEPVHRHQTTVAMTPGIWDSVVQPEAQCAVVAGSAWDHRTVRFGATGTLTPHTSILAQMAASGWSKPDFVGTLSSFVSSLLKFF